MVIEDSTNLRGRAGELQALRLLLHALRRPSGGAVVIEGDAGVGKTTLLQTAVDDAEGMRVLRITGFAAESALAFSGLQRLGAPLAAYVGGLPTAQRAAFRVATGMAEGPAPQRALVGLAALSLLAAASDDVPTVCAIDDAHLLDAESLEVLGFVARRLSAEAVALVFAARPNDDVARALAGVHRLTLTGLDVEDGSSVLRAALGSDVDPMVLRELVAFTGGNPLALIELAHEWTAEELTRAAIVPTAAPIGRTLDEHYRSRIMSLPASTRLWLLIASAESAGDPTTIRAVASDLSLPDDASTAAEATALVEVREVVRFRHPLIRSAAYNSAFDADRVRVHTRLRERNAARGFRELAAWHAAAAARGPSAELAGELAELADRAAARGGLLTRARLLARAADLAPMAVDRSGFLLAAAESAIGAGAGILARQLVDRITVDDLDDVGRGRVLLVRALCALFLSDAEGLRVGTRTLLDAAAAFGPRAPLLAQHALLLSINYVQTTEDGALGITLAGLGQRLREGASLADSPYAVALAATSSLLLDDYAVAAPRLRAAVQMLESLPDDDLLTFSIYCVSASIGSWDADAASRLLHRLADIARARGALREVDGALWVLSAVELGRMNPRRAGEYLDQAAELRRALGYSEQLVPNAAYMAWQGTPRAVVDEVIGALRGVGFRGVERMALGAIAANEIARGNYGHAFVLLEGMTGQPYMQARFPYLADFVEAAARSNHRDVATRVAGDLRGYEKAAGTRWVRGLARRCDALVGAADDAEAAYLASIAELDTPGHIGDRARSELLYGEWLRRARRRAEARAQLLRAWEAFVEVGAAEFADRARRELALTGSEPGTAGSPLHDLTPQEAQVARMAAHGDTNAEIAAALFISTNTVDYHLRKVFRKLSVTSRRQLAGRVGRTERP